MGTPLIFYRQYSHFIFRIVSLVLFNAFLKTSFSKKHQTNLKIIKLQSNWDISPVWQSANFCPILTEEKKHHKIPSVKQSLRDFNLNRKTRIPYIFSTFLILNPPRSKFELRWVRSLSTTLYGCTIQTPVKQLPLW